jgi:hypothetical protein
MSKNQSAIPDFAIEKLSPGIGKRYRQAAKDFIIYYPIGSQLTWDEFTQFAVNYGLLDTALLPSQQDMQNKQSDAWLAHLQRRHQARAKINNSARHDVMNDYGGAYTIEASGGALIVRSTAVALAENTAAKKIKSLSSTKKNQLNRLMQSTDWDQLPPHEKGLAETISIDIDNFVARIVLESNQLEQKFRRVAHRLSSLVQTGQINAPNGGITGLLTCGDEEEEDEEDEPTTLEEMIERGHII